MTKLNFYDTVVIGAGPSGIVAAEYLRQKNKTVLIIEKSKFPRFVIGESLLPSCMQYLVDLGLTEVIEEYGFQIKNGAIFYNNYRTCDFSFSEKFTDGIDYTYQAKRMEFDTLLANEIASRGVEILFETKVLNVKDIETGSGKTIFYKSKTGQESQVDTRFVIDASGYGQVLPNILKTSGEVNSVPRGAVFCHFTDENTSFKHQRNIYIHGFNNNESWLWGIPFLGNQASVGIAGSVDYIKGLAENKGELFIKTVKELPIVGERFKNEKNLFEPRHILNYSSTSTQVYGKDYILVGNTTEFLDPIFSSGVTLAITSGYLGAKSVNQFLDGEEVDWENSYAKEIKFGINVFRSYVKAWYSGDLETIFFDNNVDKVVKSQICSVLAGYVWDRKNPFVSKHETILQTLAKVLKIRS
jgi:flavin-dependent dehydrogenase